MTASIIKLDTTADDHHIARMAAVALGLTIIENAIPTPLPGVKPGLANIVTLIVLARYGWRVAAWVSLLRVVAGSLLFGSFLSPGFFLFLYISRYRSLANEAKDEFLCVFPILSLSYNTLSIILKADFDNPT